MTTENEQCCERFYNLASLEIFFKTQDKKQHRMCIIGGKLKERSNKNCNRCRKQWRDEAPAGCIQGHIHNSCKLYPTVHI